MQARISLSSTSYADLKHLLCFLHKNPKDVACIKTISRTSNPSGYTLLFLHNTEYGELQGEKVVKYVIICYMEIPVSKRLIAIDIPSMQYSLTVNILKYTSIHI